MTVQTKTSIIIISTLLIGVLLGTFISGAMTERRILSRIEEFRSMGPPHESPDNFIPLMERIIGPHEGQKDTINKILNQHFERIHDITSKHRLEMESLMNSLHDELKPILNDEQIRLLDERMNRMRRFREHRPGSGHRKFRKRQF